MNSDMNLNKVLEVCCDLAIRGGQEALKYYDDAVTIRLKSDMSPITAADLAVDRTVVLGLKSEFPLIPIISEERVETHSEDVGKGLYFLVDPIDGTKEFISRNGEFTVNIALIENDKPVLGVVFAPALDQLFFGSKGIGAFESHPKRDGYQSHSAQNIIADGHSNPRLRIMISRSHLDSETIEFIKVNPNSERIIAGSSLKFCELAAGRADIYPRFGPTMEWDTAAGQAVLVAAGGSVENLQGSPLIYGKPAFRNSAFIARCKEVKFALPSRI